MQGDWERRVEALQDRGRQRYRVDLGLISDEQIKKTRIITSVRCIEYGVVQLAPDAEEPGMLIVLKFVFQPFNARVASATIELSFTNASVLHIQPDRLDDSESEVSVRRKLAGNLSVGYPLAGVTIGLNREVETTDTQKYRRSIRGAGEQTSRVTWTLRENEKDGNGIDLDMVAVVILAKEDGEIKLTQKLNGKLGVTASNIFGYRRFSIPVKEKAFDGKTFLGKRPDSLSVDESAFKMQRPLATPGPPGG
jgi:hypothetical protein